VSHPNYIAEILPIAMRSREKILRKYGASMFRNGPRYGKSDETDNESSLCIEGWAVLFNEPIALQSGEIVVFERSCFDVHLATRETDFRLAHDETQVVGSTNSGLQFCATDFGLAYRMPLTNKRYASTIERKVESNSQSAISVGISRSTERTETIGKHKVIFIERAELIESSLVAEGCCEAAFAYLIDVNDAPCLKDSINSPSFKLESTAHNLHTQYRKRVRELAALTNRITELQQMVDDDRALMTFVSRQSDLDRIEALQKAARRRLGLD
jgi:HK97 family phage prohead protease